MSYGNSVVKICSVGMHHCLRALRILYLTGVILRNLLPVMHKSGTKNSITFTAVILNSIFALLAINAQV